MAEIQYIRDLGNPRIFGFAMAFEAADDEAVLEGLDAAAGRYGRGLAALAIYPDGTAIEWRRTGVDVAEEGEEPKGAYWSKRRTIVAPDDATYINSMVVAAAYLLDESTEFGWTRVVGVSDVDTETGEFTVGLISPTLS